MPRHSNRCGEKGNRPPHQEKQVKNKPTLKKGIVAASVVAGVAGGLVAGLALGVPGFAGASSNGVQGTAAAFAKNAVVQVADAATDTNTDSGDTVTELPGTITVQGSTDGAERTPRGPRAAIESDAVAKVLGMSTAELQTELRSGKSLADIAKAKGVDIEKVKQAIIDDFTAREQGEVAAGEHTQEEVDQKMVDLRAKIDHVVNGGMPDKGEHGMGERGPRGAAPWASEAVAKSLGLTAAELQTEIQSGKSLADIAKAKGVDIDKVKAAILEGFTAKQQAEVASGEHTQAEVDAKIAEFKTRLDDMVNGVKPAGMPGDMGGSGDRGMGGHGPRGGHGLGHDDDMDGRPSAQGGSAPTLQGSVQVQPSGANA